MLDGAWLDTIMARLAVAYPGRFPPRAMPRSLLLAEWGRELDGVTAAQLKHAMANLPAEHPPNALQFRALALTVPQPAPPPAPPPGKFKPDPVKAAQTRIFAEGIAQARSAPSDPMRWARTLRAREERGERLNRVQQASWREALRYDLAAEAVQEYERDREGDHDGSDN